LLKALIAALIVLLAVLQWRFWLGNGGIRELQQTTAEVQNLTETLQQQRDVNTALRAEVTDLVDGVGEIEERARAELGMVGPDETFYQFVGTKAEVATDNLADSKEATQLLSVPGQ
jgi:cell division protein FtsB